MRQRTTVGPRNLVTHEDRIKLKREAGAGAAIRAGTATALSNIEDSILDRTARGNDHNPTGKARAARVDRALIIESARVAKGVCVLAAAGGQAPVQFGPGARGGGRVLLA